MNLCQCLKGRWCQCCKASRHWSHLGLDLSPSSALSSLSFLIYSMRLMIPTLPIRVVVSKMPSMEAGKEIGPQQI